ncbi:MAG TPA: energy transducer TonB [Saprospiraceae bacterium]|nr:energy transducer TonB [Saprospiraceae bacterium]
MKKERKDKDFIKSAYFEGGKAALEAYVKKELRYPKEALESQTEGTVSVRYTVDYKGNVVEANVISGLGHGCDEEALRIVRSLKFKIPNEGKIKSKYTLKLHIHFRLPGSPKNLPATKKVNIEPGIPLAFQYQITPKTIVPSTSLPKKVASYEISITMPSTDKSGHDNS